MNFFGQKFCGFRWNDPSLIETGGNIIVIARELPKLQETGTNFFWILCDQNCLKKTT